MSLNEIVVCEVKGYRSLEVFYLLAECVGKASQAAHMQARCAVQTLNVVSRNKIHVRTAYYNHLLTTSYFRRAIAALLVMLALVCAVILYNHTEVYVAAESAFYSLD